MTCHHKFTGKERDFESGLDNFGAMNIYGKAMEKSKREAHGKVVRLVLESQVA